MPRRAPPPAAVAPVNTLLPPPPPSPLIQILRKDYRWASISQFCWTFSDAFGLVDWDIDRLEADFDGDETQVIPDLLVKLLFALTYNRQIKRDNVMDNIRKQYEKRSRTCVLGTMEEPVEWAALGLGLKVQLLYELCEIQMEDAARFRGLLKSEEDAVSWRIDPVGWDKEGNTYFLFDDNRLWVQRQPPAPPASVRPPKKSSLKAKRALKRQRQAPPAKAPAAKKSRPARKREDTPPPKVEKVEEPISGTRRRTQVSFYGNVTPTVAALRRGANDSTPSTSRSTRSTRGQAQETKPSAQAETPSRTRGKGKEMEMKPASMPRGTRVSRRLRDTEDEWQQVPTEWLGDQNGNGASDSKRSSRSGAAGDGTKRKKPLDEDEESELSELTDEEEHTASMAAAGPGQNGKQGDETMDVDQVDIDGRSAASSELSELEEEVTEDAPMDEDDKDDDFDPATGDLTAAQEESEGGASEGEVKEEGEEIQEEEEEGEDDEEPVDEIKLAVKEANDLPEGFVEWEAVCVTLYDWRTFPEQFAKSRDLDEKALYQLLTKQVGPTIIAALVEKAQELARQEAVLNRKRSSRIATIQLSKEEAIRAETAQREMEERMERQRYEETRHEREAAALARAEQARDDRLREREERALAREEAILARARDETEKAEKAERDRQERARRREEGFTVVTPTPIIGEASGGGNGSQADRWELNCEVCKKTGWNVDDDEDVVACEDCGRWQHMGCHDMQDMREGRKKRNWEKVDFRCKECLSKLARRQAVQSASVPNRPHVAPASNGSTPHLQHRSSGGPIFHSSPSHGPSQAPQATHGYPRQHSGSVQGPPGHQNNGPPSSSSRGPYPPPPPGQTMSPFGPPQQVSGYPPQGPPGYPPNPASSPRQPLQQMYQHGSPYPPSPYGPPPDQLARSPYHPQQGLPHPQQYAYHQGPPHLPRQTPPQHLQSLPFQQYPHPHPQAHLPPPHQGYPAPHPGYAPRPPIAQYAPHPSQRPYQSSPAPLSHHVNGHPQGQSQSSPSYPPQPRAPGPGDRPAQMPQGSREGHSAMPRLETSAPSMPAQSSISPQHRQ